MRCEPNCLCSLRPQWGDYHLGRSCRRRIDQIGDNNSSSSISSSSNSDNDDYLIQHDQECHIPPNTKIVKILNASGRGLRIMQHVISTKLHGLHFVIQKRVDHVKDDVCTSFLSVGSDHHGDGGGVGMGIHHDDEMSGGDLLEKPVKALRKALECGVDRDRVRNNAISSNNNNIGSRTYNPKIINSQREGTNQQQQGTRNGNRSRTKIMNGDSITADDDGLDEVPVLDHNPIFLKNSSHTETHTDTNSKSIKIGSGNIQIPEKIPKDNNEQDGKKRL